MNKEVVGILHPGDMGSSVAAAARSNGHRVLWCAARRSDASRRRAEEAGLEAVASVGELLANARVLLSVCPPHAADAVAGEAAAAGFSGIYVDANAVSPATAARVAEAVSAAGARYVDGGIIGPPARKAGSTRLYLSGGAAGDVAGLFKGSLLEPVILDTGPYGASALKMAYAAWTKGSTALLANVRALARANGVEGALEQEWELSQQGLEARSRGSITGSAFKAWRWVAEMHEIADSFESVALPDGFHRGAAEVYDRLSGFKDSPPPPLDDVLARLLDRQGSKRD